MNSLFAQSAQINNKWELIGYITALIVPGFLAILAAQLKSRSENKKLMSESSAMQEKIQADLKVITVNVDGRITALIDAISKASRAEGVISGTKDEQSRVASMKAAEDAGADPPRSTTRMSPLEYRFGEEKPK